MTHNPLDDLPTARGAKMKICIPEDEYKQMKRDLRELAEDVLAHLDSEYGDRENYPHMQRRFDRDSETARRVLRNDA